MNEPANLAAKPAPTASPRGSWWKLALAVSCLAVVAAAGAGTLAGFAARYGWHLELASNFRVQYFWALAAAGAGLALARWRLAALAAWALATSNLVLILPLYFGPSPRADVGPSLRAMSFNVLYLNRNHGATLELILNELPDFVFLAEVTEEFAKALEFLKPEYPYKHVAIYDESGGIAFYSRHKITDLEVKHSPLVGSPTIIVGLETPAGRLTVMGAHTISPRSADHFTDRNLQLTQMGKLARERSGPVVLVGDFNITSWSPYFQQMLRESGLNDSRRGFGVEPTWPSSLLPVLRIPIDHCLVSEEISVLNRWVGPAVGSDHRPIFIEFALPET